MTSQGAEPRSGGESIWPPGGRAANGDAVIGSLADALAKLRDRLAAEGCYDAAELVADLAEITNDYLTRLVQ
jgi:hypothetical protein